MVPGMKVLPYNECLRQLGLWTLEDKRNRADLIEMFKMLRDEVNDQVNYLMLGTVLLFSTSLCLRPTHGKH